MPTRIIPAAYYELRNTTMPAVLVEIGCHSHPRQGRRLLEPTYQQVLAEAFARAINEYLEQSRAQRRLPSNSGQSTDQ